MYKCRYAVQNVHSHGLPSFHWSMSMVLLCGCKGSLFLAECNLAETFDDGAPLASGACDISLQHRMQRDTARAYFTR